MGDPRPAAPHQLVAPAEREAVLEIRVVGVDEEPWRVGGLAAVNTVVESLHLQAVAIAGVTVPAHDDVASGDMFVAAARLVERTAKDVALKCHSVAGTRCPIEPEPRAQPVPSVVCRSALRP